MYKRYFSFRAALELMFLCGLALVISSARADALATCSPTSPTGATCGGEGPATQGNQSDQNQGAGNPINLISGNKYQREVDLPALPGVLGIEVVRHYNSQAVDFTGHVGRGWRLSYETEIRRSGDKLQLIQADGTLLRFQCSGDRCKSARWADGFVEQTSSGYMWRWVSGREAGRVLSFDNNGLLKAIRTATGYELTIMREKSGRIREVNDPQGRKLVFHYPSPQDLARNTSRFDGVSAIDTPLGRVTFSHGSPIPVSLPSEQLAATLTIGDKPIAKAYIERQSNLVAASMLAGAQKVYHYESVLDGQASLLTGISVKDFSSSLSRQSTYLYDAGGKAVLSTKGEPARLDPNGGLIQGTGVEQIGLIRNVQGQTLLINSLGQYTLYKHAVFNGQSRITEAIGSGCAQCGAVNMRYRFDKSGNLIELVKLSPTIVEVDAKGNAVLASTPSAVQSELYERDSQGRIVGAWQTKAGLKVLIEKITYVDAKSDRPERISKPSIAENRSRTTSFLYNEYGQVTQVQEQGYGPLISIDGNALAFEKIERVQLFSYSWINSRSVLVRIDGPLPNGPLHSPADSDITEIQYDSLANQVVQTTHPMGLLETSTFDSAGRVIRHHASNGLITKFSYSIQSALQPLATVAGGIAIGNSYDSQGRIIASSNVQGKGIVIAYDAFGRMVSVADAQGYKQSITFDSENHQRILSAFEPNAGQALRAEYRQFDAFSRLTHRLQPDGRLDAFEFDDSPEGLGRLSQHADGDDVLHLFRRGKDKTAQAQLSLATDGMMRVQFDTYSHGSSKQPQAGKLVDDFGRTVFLALPDHGIKLIAYNATGYVVQTRIVGKDGKVGATHNFTRDAANRLIGKASTGGGAAANVSISYKGAQQVKIDDDTQSTTYGYDENGRISSTQIAIKGKQSPSIYSANLKTFYDPKTGEVSEQQLADGRIMSTTRNPLSGTPQTISLKRQLPWWNFWDSAIEQVVSDLKFHPFNGIASFTLGNGINHKKEFDIAGRVTALNTGGTSLITDQRFEYGAGPRIKTIHDKALPLGQAAYSYGGFGALLKPIASRVQAVGMQTTPLSNNTFDAFGRMTEDSRFKYTYSIHGQIETVSNASTGKLVATYRYNASKQRVSKELANISIYYLWHNNKLVGEINQAGQLTAQYLFLNEGTKPIPIVKLESMNGTASNTRTLFIHTDHRAAPIAMTNSKQQLVWKAHLNEWGINQTEQTTTNHTSLNIRFPGQYYDAETGLHDNWHRTYNPITGRYLQPDPLGYPDGPDAYLYASGDPVNRLDVKGLYEEDVHYYLMVFLARASGLPYDQAHVIGQASQYIDDNYLTEPIHGSVTPNFRALPLYHFTRTYEMDTSNDAALRILNPTSSQLDNLWKPAFDGMLSVCTRSQLFGEYMHAFADTFSHRDQKNVPFYFTSTAGHGLYNHDPDQTYNIRDFQNNEMRTLEMAKETFQWMQSFGGSAASVSWDVLAPMVTSFSIIGKQEGVNANRWQDLTNTTDFEARKQRESKSKQQFLDQQLQMLGLGRLTPAVADKDGNLKLLEYDKAFAQYQRSKNLRGLAHLIHTQSGKRAFEGILLPSDQ